jgi:integrase
MTHNKNIVKITKTFTDKALPLPNKDQTFYRDSILKGFALRITSAGVKSFVVEKIIGNKVRRITIGKYSGALTVEQARKKAQILLGQIADGINPIEEKQITEMNETTLEQVMQDYLKSRKTLKPKTLYDYNRIMTVAFADWKKLPILQITKDKVEKLHTKLGENSGEAYANLAMRILRALFNFAAGKYEDAQGRSLIVDNPVRRLSQTRAWYRVERRQTFIQAHELKSWYEGIQKLANQGLRDYFMLILLTGLRRQEAASLRWDQVDFKAKSLRITDTKNNEPHTLPLSTYLRTLLQARREQMTNEFVFPAPSASGHIIESRKQIAKVVASSGVTFTVHDLRRTFITIAESLDIPAYALKRLLNHKMHNDVTAGYIVTDVERLRSPMQKITDYILKRMGIHLPGKIAKNASNQDIAAA